MLTQILYKIDIEEEDKGFILARNIQWRNG